MLMQGKKLKRAHLMKQNYDFIHNSHTNSAENHKKCRWLYSTFFFSVTFQNTSDCLTLMSQQREFYDASGNQIYASNNRVVIK